MVKDKIFKILKEQTKDFCLTNLIAVRLEFETEFLPWLIEQCKLNEIKVDFEKDDVDYLFSLICKIKNINTKEVFTVNSALFLFDNDEHIYVGTRLENFNELYSFKRCKIETFEYLKKLNICKEEDDYDDVNLYTNFIIVDNERISNGKGKK